ncbi:hypothetical protein CQW23_32223 [Capsicum baccatum]|uniref:Uncharacterized protein n=1 Tax=Capsicum baccatum TaxID=33114 RepID=A0A2G2V5D0_CAPBA|nr:hypothetical protein CQW23_32223 [Capsicum baccatum]
MGRSSQEIRYPVATTGVRNIDTLNRALADLCTRSNPKGHDLLVFAKESVVVYLEDEDGATRKDDVLCYCKLVANSFSVISST